MGPQPNPVSQNSKLNFRNISPEYLGGTAEGAPPQCYKPEPFSQIRKASTQQAIIIAFPKMRKEGVPLT
jgi:hypothetical protein